MKKTDNEDNDEPLGFDLVDDMPDYSKTPEENEEIYRERFKKVYGRYPGETKN